MKRKLSDAEVETKEEIPSSDAEEDFPISHDADDHPVNGRRKCPYLDTINRQALDFDSEKLCSVTLTNMNVYVCLVCGKYFQGRGKSTPAYTHSVQAGHFVFMNLASGRTFCLPDSYEVFDSSLQDAQKCLSPTYSLQDLDELNSNTSLARDVHGVTYLPGFVGLNNLNCTDYVNALLHALAHVTPFRDFWLQNRHYEMSKSSLVHHFGLTLRKMWSSNNFKSTVSPQELVQELSVLSKRRFGLGQRAECLDLLVWLLGSLHRGLSKSPITSSSNGSKALRGPDQQAASPVYEPFQGVIEVTSLTKRLVSSADELKQLDHGERGEQEGEWVRTVTQVPFSFLSVEIPPCPLFRDSEGGQVIPQIPLFQLLQKFDGETWTDSVTSEAHVRRKYRILQLPRYLVLHLVRFTRNNFYLEKNPTIVTFPVRNLEMKDFLATDTDSSAGTSTAGTAGTVGATGEGGSSLGSRRIREEARLGEVCPSVEEVRGMSAAQLRQVVTRVGSELQRMQMQSIFSDEAGQGQGQSGGAIELSAQQRKDLLRVALSAVERVELFSASKYDLLANICHSADASSSTTKGGITVGDLNMLMGQPTAGSHKAKTAAAAGRAAGSGAQGSVNAGTAQQQQDTPSGHSVYTSASAAATNNKVLNDGSYRVHLQHKATGQWFEIQDLHVNEISPQLIGVSESNILIYEKKTSK